MSEWIVRKLTPDLLEQASELSWRQWHAELGGEGSEEEQRDVYRYFVRYYYHPSSPFNYAVCEEGRLVALLMAYGTDDSDSLGTAYYEAALQAASSNGRRLLAGYRSYLLENQRQLVSAASADDVFIGLFLSIRKGCGRCLLEQLYADTTPRHVLLWTDASCDFDYYPSHGFELAAEVSVPELLKTGMAKTYIYRR